MRRTPAGKLILHAAVWLIALAGVPEAALAKNSDDWRVRGVHNQDYWWHRSPPPVIAPTESDRLADSLDLTEDQRTILADLIEGTTQSFAGLWLECAEAYDDTRYANRQDRRWNEIRREMAALRERYLGHFDEGRERVLSDLEAILTSTQQERWEAAMRGHRRRTTLVQYSNIEGEALDLVGLVALLDLDDVVRSRLDTVLTNYELELDSALLSRIATCRRMERFCRQYLLMIQEHEDTPEWKKEFAKVGEDITRPALRVWEVSRRIRHINDRYSTLVRAELPTETHEAFTTLLAKTPHPGGEARRGPRALRMLKFAEAMDSASNALEAIGTYSESRWYTDVARAARTVEPLTPAQRHEIKALREEFDEKHTRLLRDHGMHEFQDPSENHLQVHCREGVAYLTRKERKSNGRSSGRDRAEYYKALGELNEETVRALREVLTLNQRILLQTRE